MRELFEDAILVYRQEADSLLAILTVTSVISLILLILSAVSLTLALAAVPLFVLTYLSSYSLCLQWAGTMSTSRMSGHRPWLELLGRAPPILYAAGPGLLLTMLVTGSAVIAGHEGFWYLSVAGGLLGIAAGAQWLVRHAYDLPLVVVFDAPARDAMDAGERLEERAHDWTVRLIALLSAPLVVVGAICAGLSMMLAPLAGAAAFVLALTAWIPLAALVLTSACQRQLDEQGAPERMGAAAIS